MYLWGLDAAYREAARAKGVRIMANARVERAKWADRHWQLETRVGVVVAGVVVNAAGAWADDVAIRAGASPLGIQPYRRTIVQLRTDPAAPGDLPLVIDALNRFYFKPEAGGRLWLSPHDETACPASDRSEEHTSELQSLMRISYAVFCL